MALILQGRYMYIIVHAHETSNPHVLVKDGSKKSFVVQNHSSQMGPRILKIPEFEVRF